MIRSRASRSAWRSLDGRRTLTVTRASELAETNDSNVLTSAPYDVGDDVGEALRELGGEAVAREVHEHGRPQTGRFRDLEHADDAPFLQPDDLPDEVGDLGRREFEHDVAWKVLEHRSRRPAGVAVHGLADEAELDGDLVAEAGDVEHARPLRSCREQADEAMLQRRLLGVADDQDAEALRRGTPSTRCRPEPSPLGVARVRSTSRT